MIWSWRSMIPASSTSTEWSSFGLPRNRARTAATALLIIGSGLLHGCFAIPVPVSRPSGPAAASRVEVSKTLPEQIVAGQTTRTEVLLLLGEPDGRGDLDRWFTYGSRIGRGGAGWALLWGFGLPYGAATGGIAALGDWETVHRAIIRFDDSGVVSTVDFIEKNCTAAKCIDVGGQEIKVAEEAERVLAVRTTQLAAAGEILAKYAAFQWTVVHAPDCRGSTRALTHANVSDQGFGHELLIAEHAILRSEHTLGNKRGEAPRQGEPAYSVLAYDEIAEVRPIERHLFQQWIPIRTRSGSCFYVTVQRPQLAGLSSDEARTLILAHVTGLTTGAPEPAITTPAVSGPTPPAKQR
jgi:hypothetical protein